MPRSQITPTPRRPRSGGTIAAVLAGALVLTGCATSPADSEVTRDQTGGYRAAVNQFELAAAQYDVNISRAMPALCDAIFGTYNVKVRDIVAHIDQLDEPLDATITSHGGAAYADLVCTTQAIVVELDYHGAVACRAPTIEDNRAEAGRHLLAIGARLEHALARIMEIETGLATGAQQWTWSLPNACP